MATVFINNPGNLSNYYHFNRLNSLVEEMEHLPESWGPKSTNFFLREFLSYKKSIDDVSEIDQEKILSTNSIDLNFNELPTFLKWPENNYWQGFIRYKSNE